jgi:hypothetical protein
MSPLEGALEAIFPKIDPVAEPVVVVTARLETGLAGKNIVHDRTVASVIAKNKAIPRHNGRVFLTIGLPEFSRWRNDSDPLEKCACRCAALIDSLGSPQDGLTIPDGLCVG